MLNVIKVGEVESIAPYGKTYGEEELHAMQRAIIRIFSRWGVSDVDAATILGGISVKTIRM